MTKPKKNVFDLTHDFKFSFNMGQLVPVCCMEAVPGDKFKIGCTSLLRFAPLIAPVMHRMDVSVHYFFVPNRILWPNWENFITGTPQEDGTPYVQPYATIVMGDEPPVYWANGSLADYMGISPKVPAGIANQKVAVMAFAAYQKIYDDYYRDQNMITSEWEPLDDGDNSTRMQIPNPGVPSPGNLSSLRLRAWEHDYFTASLPFAQKGSPVNLPLGTVVLSPEASLGLDNPVGLWRGAFDRVPGVGGDPLTMGDSIPPEPDNPITADGNPTTENGVLGKPLNYDPNGSLVVGETTINDLRRAFRLQEWLEKNARGGTRYIENILAHFGVQSSDKRMQRAEYIVGTKSPVIISEIVNTTGTETVPQGNMAGHGLNANAGKVGSYYCEEHGFIIGVLSVMPKTAYMNGIPRFMLKYDDQFDYFWPSFANIGEQEVYNEEIFGFQENPKTTFGYLPRYAEYKAMPSRVAGDFRSNLAFWHLARSFDTAPALNQAFIECVPRDDIFAVTDPSVQKMYCHFLNQVRAVRPMPKYGTPHGV